jgi:hypothetical protein
MKVTRKNRRLVIDLPISELRPSASGKTLVVASSHGVRKTNESIDGRTVCVNANAFCFLPVQVDMSGIDERVKEKSKKTPRRKTP